MILDAVPSVRTRAASDTPSTARGEGLDQTVHEVVHPENRVGSLDDNTVARGEVRRTTGRECLVCELCESQPLTLRQPVVERADRIPYADHAVKRRT